MADSSSPRRTSRSGSPTGCPGKIDEDGATTVPAKLLTDLVELAAGRRQGRARGDGRRHAPRQGRPIPDPHQGHRRRGVPRHPDRRRATDDADRPERPPTSPRRDGLRRRQRRGATDPDRRPGPVRGRPADARGRRQLPDRRQDRADPRRGAGDQRRDPGPGAQRALAGAGRRRRPGRRRARAGPEPGALPPRRDRPRQPADRRPVPELPAGHAQGARDAGRARSRGAAPGRPPGGADRPRVGQHREARRSAATATPA